MFDNHLNVIVFYDNYHKLTFSFCTSVISQDQNGQVWHSRNLDYSFTDILKNITVAVDFQKGGKACFLILVVITLHMLSK